MKQNSIKKTSVSIIGIFLLVAFIMGFFSSFASTTVYAASIDDSDERFEVDGIALNKDTLVLLSKLETLEMRIDGFSNKVDSYKTTIEKEYDGVFKPKKIKTTEEKLQNWQNGIKTLNSQLPGIIDMIKDLENGGDFSAANCIKTSVSTVSSIASLCGPWGQLIGAGLTCAETISMMALGGTKESSEITQLNNELDLQFNDIKNELADLEATVKELSDEINDSTNKIIEEMPAALEREDDKQQVRKFLLRYEGNFSYNQFRNYLYGDTIQNSNSSTAYYSWLQDAIVKGESEELLRRYYDDLYYAITNEIDDFEDYLAPNDNNIKSIVKTYYDYLSSNPEFSSKYGMTPEEAAVQFAYELYQTELMADSLIMSCNTYQYIQMLLNEQDYYESYDSSFVVSKSQIDEMYSAIEARQNNISLQMAKDMAYVMGLNDFYLLEEKDGETYLVNRSQETYANVFLGQKVYMNHMPDAICELFGYDKYAFSFEVNSNVSDGYFSVNNSVEPITVDLKYQDDVIQTTTFRTNTNSYFTGGAGTYADPYLISTKEQFMLIEEGLDQHYLLTRDIDMGGATINPFGFSINSNGGETTKNFTGTLDGNGYTISNLNIKGGIHTGLFSVLGTNGTVRNLTLSNISVKANLNSAESSDSNSFFYIGAFAGENYGKIKNCTITKSPNAETDVVDISFILNNTVMNQSIYVYAGGITGANHNLVSACRVENVSIQAESNHSFGGENTKKNKNNVYAGGLVGYNGGLLGYSIVSSTTKIIAKAHSILSPDDTVNPYVVGLGGGVCGKVEEGLPDNDMVNLYSGAETSGVAYFDYVDSRWGKYYRNRIQNDVSETNCYVPGWSSDKNQKVSCYEGELNTFLQSRKAQYCVELENITSVYDANDTNFDTSKMKVAVTDEVLNDVSYRVTDFSIVAIYGFTPYNEFFEFTIDDQALIVVKITLDNGDTFIAIESSDYTIGKNDIHSIEIVQEDKKFIADKKNSAIQLSELNGQDNVTYNYLVGSESRSFDCEKLINHSIKTTKLITCERCNSYNLSTVLNGADIEYTCQEEECKHIGTSVLQAFDYLYKGETGRYVATIAGKYDGVDVTFTFEYVVDCPHIVYEAEHLTVVKVITPTCISVGYTQYECLECHEMVCKNYTNKTDVHQFQTIEDESYPTCYKNGNSSAIVCSVCGHVKEESRVIPKLEHNYEEIVYIYDGSSVKVDDYGNKVSERHKCTNAETATNGNETYHYENHQYKVTESVLPQTTMKDGKEFKEYYVVYTYSCECGYSKIIPDENLIVDENSELPTVIVSNGYAIHGGSEVTVYVQLLNNPGIAGANFGIRYDSRLRLKEFSDGTVISGSITSDSNEVNFGYNFVWANADYRTDDGNLLKLVFIVPDNAKLPTENSLGDIYNISVVYNIENGSTGGFTEKGKKDPQCYVTRDGTITMVKRLPGDVNNDGFVDLLDAVEIGQFLVHKKDSIDETYANVDLSYNDKANTNVNVSDMVAILQSITGGYGVNLLSQEFQVTLNGNGFNLGEDDVLYVSIYNEYNNTYQEAGLKELEQKGYKFDGWWTKLVGGEQIILADGQISQVRYFDYQKKQVLYAHWTLNTVTLDGNGNTNDIVEPTLSYTEDYKPGIIDTHYEQEYAVIFSDNSKEYKQPSVEKTLKFTLIGWALSAESAKTGKYDYLPDLSDLDLSVANLGELTLYAVWDDGALEYPIWDKQEVGYEPVQWYTNAELTSLLDVLNNKMSNEIIKSNALMTGDNRVNVYAGFEPVNYTIRFDANGGVGSKLSENNHNVENKNSLNLNTTISRAGWNFKGWSLTPNGKVQYADGATVGYIPTPELQSDGSYAITLYAQWEPIEYIVTFDANGGNVNTTTKKVFSGQNYGELPVPERTGFRFIGWYTDYSTGTEISEKTVMSAADNQTLYAHWQSEVIYTLGSDGKYSATGLNYDDISNLVILSEYSPNGRVTPLPVTSIGASAFYNCSQLQSVIIPNSVINIGYNAFGNCNNLNSITLPFVGATLNGTTNAHFGYIFGASDSGQNVYNVPESLKTVVITKATNYGTSAFYHCEYIESISLPSGTTSISDSMFYWCSRLTQFNIPSTVTNIGANAFQRCHSLTKVEIPSQVKSVGDSAFMHCSNLESVNILPGLTSIGNDAFYGCSKLSNAGLPSTLVSIGEWAFYDCSALTSLTLPSSLTGIGVWAFRESGLKTVSFNSNSQMKTLGEGAFGFCDALTSISLPSSLTSIGDGAFEYCTSLMYISIPDGVNDIGYGAFAGCSSLSSFSWPSKITEIKNGMFQYCTGLTSFYIPSGVTSIGQVVFWDCTGLKRVDIPKSVTSIDYKAFDGCTALEVAYYEGKPSEWNSITFGDGNDILKSKVSCKQSDSCFTGDTLVMLEDGNEVRIDSLKQGDIIMSWNAITGEFQAMPISLFWNHGEQDYNVIRLHFSNGKTVKVVNDHGFFDATLNKYVYIDANNYSEYIGHEFAHMTMDSEFEKVILIAAEVSHEVSSCYSLRTACNDNAIVEGFLTLTHEDIDGFLTYFEFGDDYMYDEEKMEADIEKYGLYSYDDWNDYVSYEEFVALNGQYLTVAIGKGYLTYEDVLVLIAGMR